MSASIFPVNHWEGAGSGATRSRVSEAESAAGTRPQPLRESFHLVFCFMTARAHSSFFKSPQVLPKGLSLSYFRRYRFNSGAVCHVASRASCWSVLRDFEAEKVAVRVERGALWSWGGSADRPGWTSTMLRPWVTLWAMSLLLVRAVAQYSSDLCSWRGRWGCRRARTSLINSY